MMSIQSKIMSQYQNNNPEKFSNSFLTLKENDDPKKYLEVAMHTLDSIEGITYLRMEELQHRVYETMTEEELKENKLNISVDKSLLKIYRFYFNIEKDDRKEEIFMDLFYPELIKGQYFLINNNRYFPTFQLLDSGFFNTSNAVVLKTLIMPIVMELKEEALSLNIFKKKMSPFFYYFAKFNFYETLEYFGIKDKILIIDNLNELNNYENEFKVFEINKKFYFCIVKEAYEEDYLIYNSIKNCFNSRLKIEKIEDINYWKKKLGTLFSNTTDKIAKANSTLISFERGLDLLNKELLRLPEDDKKDIYSIIRYMIRNYMHLKTRNNCDLANKRIRSNEYLIYPLLRRFTAFVRRINNGRKITFEKLCDFRPSKGFLVKCMITNELLRYDNSCNSANIVSKLRISQSGFQSQFSSGAVKIEYRTNHHSFIGKIGLLETSAGDPGCSMVASPFLELYDNNHFTEKEL